MAVDVFNNCSLPVIVSPEDTALQKSSAADLPSQNRRDFVVLDNPVVIESDRFSEKGRFIDIYI